MIKIEEKKSRKLPLDTSLFISFDYNENIINCIKKSELSRWDSKLKDWEVPTTELSRLIEQLRTIDSLQIIPYNELPNQQLNSVVNYKTTPFKYQKEGIEYGLNHSQWLLLDQMGLGKSLQAIYLAEELKQQKGIKHCLIICGVDALKTNWKLEIQKHSKESCIVLGEKVNRKGNITWEPITKRAEQLKNPIEEFFIIAGIATFRSKEIIEAFKKSSNQIDMIVIDEIHAIRNVGKKGSQQGNNALELDAPYKIGMTGTPIMKEPTDVYAPLAWINAIPKGKSMFQNYYCLFGDNYQIVGNKNTDILTNILHDHSLRRTIDVLKYEEESKELPHLEIIHEVLDLNSDQSKFYNQVMDGIQEGIDKVKLNHSNLFSINTRLRQASSCPSMLTTESISSTKIDRAVELIENIVDSGEKVVVYSIYKEPLRTLANRISHHKPLIGTGEMKEDEFYSNVNSFQNDPNCKVFLGTIQKMGTGITLTSAPYAIFLDADWNAEIDKQAEARIHRIGQTKPCFIYYLWNNDTIDIAVKRKIEAKLQIADYMVDDIVPEDEDISDILLGILNNTYSLREG